MIPAGQAIGNYRILSKIGTGGMGVVYLAEHPLIGKKVALKVIHSDLATQREVVQRFFQEAWAVNKIGDDHIVEIHDFGVTPDGDHFYIMEFLDGQNLANVIAHRPMDVVRALHIGAQIASALGAAHAAGVMHRDLKPDNIMLTTRLGDPDFVKLLDFGLAKVFINAEASTVKTAAGILLGTPQYMSPEACESRGNVDHRTDIYALGILLFQMMTGVLPFDGESVGEVLVKQVTQLPPPPRGIHPAIPPSVEQIILRCLIKEPDKRFPTMMDLRAALLDPEAYLQTGPPIAPARALRPGEASAGAKTIVAQTTGAPELVDSPQHANSSGPTHGQSGDEELSHLKGHVNAGVDMAVPNVPVGRTMVIPTPVGYASRRANQAWFVVAVVGVLLVVGGSFVAARWARQDVAADGLALVNEDRVGHPDVISGSASGLGAVSDAAPLIDSPADGAPPAQAAIDAPPTSIDGPEKSATRTSGSKDANGDAAQSAVPGTASSAGSATVSSGSTAGSNAPPDAASGAAMAIAPSPGSADTPSTVVVTIDSVPRGADVIGSDDKVLGKTPAKLLLPIASQAFSVRLKLAGYHTRTKRFVVTGNSVIAVPLDRLSPAKRRDKRREIRVAPRGSDDLERP